MHEKEGVEWKHQFDKKNCVQKHQFKITGLWQFKRLLWYNRPIRSTFKSSQNTAFRQFNFMCLDAVKWTAHLGKVEREENNFHNVYLVDNWWFWMIKFLSKVRGVKTSLGKLNVQGYLMLVTTLPAVWRQQTQICGETVSPSLYLFFKSDLTNSQIGANWSNCETSRLVYSGGVPFVRSLRMDRDWGGGGYGNCYCVWEGNKWSKSERSLSDDVWLHWSLSSPDVEPSVAILSADTPCSMFYLSL